MASTPEKNAQDIIGLQKDFSALASIVNRFDMALEKLTELQSGISQILAVQESRLSNQERISEQLKTTIEDRRKESDINFKDLSNKMERLEADIENDANKRHDSLMEQIKKNNEDPKMLVKELHTRIDKIERWYWISMGVILTVGILIDKIDFSRIF